MKVLIGTTNSSKINRFKGFLEGCDIEFFTLSDLKITSEPDEQGRTPEENAIIKATYYGKFFDIVITNDSGLYFDCLSLEDPRQPGLNIRTPNGRSRMNDEESIEYYSALIHSLGGRVSAFYLDGFAVFNKGKVYSFMEDIRNVSSFYMIDTPSESRHDGWPLDSLSVRKNSLDSFTESNKNTNTEENIILGKYRENLIGFLKSSIGIV